MEAMAKHSPASAETWHKSETFCWLEVAEACLQLGRSRSQINSLTLKRIGARGIQLRPKVLINSLYSEFKIYLLPPNLPPLKLLLASEFLGLQVELYRVALTNHLTPDEQDCFRRS